ncbi:hypothetical protein M422DRAFT_27884 [Sphaerobolus stellatus SS14]|nr:hypothetical protein M422DRAFT_27884 [Sphaerobolus stellatus SS14]
MGPRNTIHPPSLYIPGPSPVEIPNPFRDSIRDSSVSREPTMFQVVPITPLTKTVGNLQAPYQSPTNHSHFSPDTPTMEKGMGNVATLRRSISARFIKAVRDQEDSGFSKGGQTRSNWIPWCIAGVLLFLLLANVVYLDIRLISTTANTGPSGSKASATSQNVPASVRIVPSLTATTNPPIETANLADQSGFSNLASNCISNFPANAATDVNFCNKCFSALQAIPKTFFNPQDPNSQRQSVAVANALLFCTNSGFAPS